MTKFSNDFNPTNLSNPSSLQINSQLVARGAGGRGEALGIIGRYDQLIPRKSWNFEVSIIPRILQIRAAGGWLLWLGFPGMDYFWNIAPGISGYPGNIGNIISMCFAIFTKKGAQRKMTQNGPIFFFDTASRPNTKTV